MAADQRVDRKVYAMTEEELDRIKDSMALTTVQWAEPLEPAHPFKFMLAPPSIIDNFELWWDWVMFKIWWRRMERKVINRFNLPARLLYGDSNYSSARVVEVVPGPDWNKLPIIHGEAS